MFEISNKILKNVEEKCQKDQSYSFLIKSQDKTKIGPLFDFLQNFSIFLLRILNIALNTTLNTTSS